MMKRIYIEEEVQARIDELAVKEEKEDQDMSEPTYKEVFCGPEYRRPSWVGIILFLFSQLTMIDVVMMYSNTLLTDIGISELMLTFLIGLFNLIASFIGLALLNCAGRRTLMLIFNASMAVILIVLSISINFKWNTFSIILVLAFISAFEFSAGPICWVYMAEIM